MRGLSDDFFGVAHGDLAMADVAPPHDDVRLIERGGVEALLR